MWPLVSSMDWQGTKGTSLQRADAHLDLAKYPFPTNSLPAELCYAAARPTPGHQKYMHTSLHLSKFSRNQARHTTRCSSALACVFQSAPWCDGAGSLLPTKHIVLSWQKSSRLPALQVNVFQHRLCRPLAALQHSRIDNYKPGYCRWLKSANRDLH